MLLIIHNDVVIDNTGTTPALKDEASAKTFWLRACKPHCCPDVPESALAFRWYDDDSTTAKKILETGGRATIGASGQVVHGTVPVPPVDKEALKTQLADLISYKAAQVELAEDTTATQTKINDLKTQILAAV